MTKVGRPTKYNPDVMLPQVIELMEKGGSLTEVAAKLGITRETLNQWRKEHEEFSDTVKRGEQLSAAWWEANGRVNLENQKFNYTGWYMQMKNRFGWKDKQDITSDGQALTVNVIDFKNDA